MSFAVIPTPGFCDDDDKIEMLMDVETSEAIESLRDDIRLVAEAVAVISTKVDALHR